MTVFILVDTNDGFVYGVFTDEDKLVPLWENTYRPSFEAIVYGGVA